MGCGLRNMFMLIYFSSLVPVGSPSNYLLVFKGSGKAEDTGKDLFLALFLLICYFPHMSAEHDRDEDIEFEMGKSYGKDEFLYRASTLLAMYPDSHGLAGIIERTEKMPDNVLIRFEFCEDRVTRPVYSLRMDLGK